MTPINLAPRVSGLYTFEKVSKATGERTRLSAKAENLLLVEFFRFCLSQPELQNWGLYGMAVGSGNSEPSVFDTGLDNFIAGTRTSNAPIGRVVNSTVSPYYITRSVTHRFNGSNIANVPLSEVGMTISPLTGAITNSSVLGSRALIVDSLGSPTSIVVLEDEFLDITYSLTSYAIEAEGSFDINVLGTVETFNYEIRPVSMNSNNAWTDFSFGQNSGPQLVSFAGASGAGSVSFGSDLTTFYDPSASSPPPGFTSSGHRFESYKQFPVWDAPTMSSSLILSMPLDNGVFPGGIRSIFLTFKGGNNSSAILGAHQMLLDRPIPKTEEHIFEMPIVMSMSNYTPPEP